MKKQLIMMACMLMASIAAFAGTNSKILLQHEGGVKVYDSNQMPQAMNDAVKGDTIFLSEGSYPGFDLTKEITIRGAGKMTIINGAVKISVTGNPTFSAPSLESLYLSNTLTVAQPCKKLHIKKCNVNGNVSFSAKSEDVLIDRCENNNLFYLSSNITSMTVVNSLIRQLNELGTLEAGSVTFVNCEIINFFKLTKGQHFINCIFGLPYSTNSCIENSRLVNCLYNISSGYNSNISSSCASQSCYAIDYSGYLTALSADELLSSNYLGNDGTIVGKYGGNTPFVADFIPSAPKVTDSSLKLDLDNKKLNVSLKVTAE